MIPPTVMRYREEELEHRDCVVVRGITEKLPMLCAIGWVEENGPHQGDEAIVINEPMYFICTPSDGRTPPCWQYLTLDSEVPLSVELFEFTRLDTYDGGSNTAKAYRKHLVDARNFSVATTILPLMTILNNMKGK